MDATRTYTVILEPAEEGGFTVHVSALPEVVTEGDTETEALAKEAIEVAVEYRLSQGEDVLTEQEAPQLRQVTVSVDVPSAA